MQAPHPPLRDYYLHEAERGDWVRQLFDRTAGDYDRIERVMAFGSGSWYRRRALSRAGLLPGMRVLDIGVGTGLMARQAAGLVGALGSVTGVDPSSGMIQSAKVPPGVELLIGSAEGIPVLPATADFLCMGYALRHIADMSAAFREFMRVLKPGGRICLLEITRPEGRASRAIDRRANTEVPMQPRLLLWITLGVTAGAHAQTGYFQGVTPRPADVWGFPASLTVTRSAPPGGAGELVPALYTHVTTDPGTRSLEWANLTILNNHSDFGANVAAYAQANKFGNGPTWGGVFEAQDMKGTGALWGVEIDAFVCGDDGAVKEGSSAPTSAKKFK